MCTQDLGFLGRCFDARFEVGRIEPKMGIKGSTTGELFFNDMRVPADNLLGEEGDGFKIAMRILDRSRPGIGAQGLGLAQGATDYALEYAKDRETMGKPIAQHQLIGAQLADMETNCEAAAPPLQVRQMIDTASTAQLRNRSMSKLYCILFAMDVPQQSSSRRLRVRRNIPSSDVRDAKITQIY